MVVVSTNEGHWLPRCLTTVYEHAGDASVQVIVVDNSSTDGTREIVERGFPQATVVTSPNRGFAYGNNRGIEQAHARYVLLLNPDTEVLEGTFGELVTILDSRPEIGLAGAIQLRGDHTVGLTLHRFPTVGRAFGDALSCERWPVQPAWACPRVTDPDVYARQTECDWTSGSFLLVRREALLAAGLLDERFFIYSEEPDLCRRIRTAGWQIWHLPEMTIVHHAGKAGVRPRMLAQDAYARKQYATKHFTRAHRALYLAGLRARHAIRLVAARSGEDAAKLREGARLSLHTLSGRVPPPFGEPPPTAISTGTVAHPSPPTPPTPPSSDEPAGIVAGSR